MQMKELTDIQFDTFVKMNNIDSIYQTSTYAKVMKKNGYQTLLLGLFDDKNTIVGASLVFIETIDNFKYAYTPRGFIIDFNNPILIKDFTMHLKKFLKDRNIVAAKINPILIKNTYNAERDIIKHNNYFNSTVNQLKNLGYYHLGYNSNFESLKPRYEAIVPLNKDIYAIFKNIKKHFRTKIRNADKSGIIIHKGTKEHINILYEQIKKKYPRNEKFLTDIYQAFKSQNAADVYYAKIDTTRYLEFIKSEYDKQENICEELDSLILDNLDDNSKIITKKMLADNKLGEAKEKLKQATQLMTDYPNGIILASALIITNEKTVTLFIDGHNKNFHMLNAKHLLLWKIIEKYAKLGYKELNLGGITNIFDNENKYDGLNQFKLSFNPKVIEYAGDFELICNTPLYFMYRNSRKIKKMIKK